MSKLSFLLVGCAAAQNPFLESAKFERWSHFKDYGVPAVMGKDALNSAAIADGSCRMENQVDGYYFWHYPDRVQRVLQALKDAPPTSNPSYFTLSVEEALHEACGDKGEKASKTNYTLSSLAGSVQNWYHALAAPASDDSWKGEFDPAYQPQQVALTTGFVCIAACDLNQGTLSTSALRSLAEQTHMLPDSIKRAYPWKAGNTIFSGAKSLGELAESLKPILHYPCQCRSEPETRIKSNIEPRVTNSFIDSAKFERWSHFKDYGVPAVMGKDALNSAAIADGTCRMLNQVDGSYFWHYPGRVQRVLQALKDAPPTGNPSYFTLTTEKALKDACSDKGDKRSSQNYTLSSLAGSVQNWYHALTAPASDASWKGQFDPAYQPQQIALTTGFMCTAACDLNNRELSSSALKSLAEDPQMLPETVNRFFPWTSGSTIFSGAKSLEELASKLKPLLHYPCQCWGKPAMIV